MLKVDDCFKAWMRRRLTDKDYADRVMHALVDSKDCTLVKVHPHAALPVNQPDDPEVMIGLWGIYDPAGSTDIERLPRIYEVAFVQSESDEPLIKRRWILTAEKDGVTTSEKEYEDVKINLINTSIDSELIQIITGHKAGEL